MIVSPSLIHLLQFGLRGASVDGSAARVAQARAEQNLGKHGGNDGNKERIVFRVDWSLYIEPVGGPMAQA